MPLSPWDWERIQSLVDEMAERGSENRRSKLRRWVRENTTFLILLVICGVITVVFAAFIVPFWVDHWSSLQACPMNGSASC